MEQRTTLKMIANDCEDLIKAVKCVNGIPNGFVFGGERIFFVEGDNAVPPIKIYYDSIPEKIERVIFNAPATIVYWQDGTKTVVKAQNNETFDKEKGLAMCIVKKMFGNRGNYNEVFKKWCQ